MNNLGFWLADTLALALEPSERSAVRGDHSELGSSGLRAAWDVGGLVVRRQLKPWAGWLPWFLLVTLVLPVTLAVPVSLEIGRGLAQTALRGATPPTGLLFPVLPGVAFMIALWSWSCNFTLAALSGRRSFVNQAFFWLLALFCVWSSGGSLRGDGGVLKIAAGILAVVVVFAIPALTGSRRGRAGVLPPRTVCATLAIAPAAIVAMLSFFWLGPTVDGWPMFLLLLLASWPGVWICGRRYSAAPSRPQGMP